MSLANRSYQKEILDEEHIPFKDIKLNMEELNTINTFLGGHKITCKGVAFFLQATKPGKTLSILEIGSGGGDNLNAIHKHLSLLGIKHKLTGIDIKQECLDYASARHAYMNAVWICSDYKTTNMAGERPDVIFSSLFCHHFTDNELVEQLIWMKNNSRLGFFINDLHRHPVAYHSIKLLTAIFSKSYLVKNDAPLSIKRGFIRSDWERLLALAGISHYSLEWKWAFRHLICVANEQQ